MKANTKKHRTSAVPKVLVGILALAVLIASVALWILHKPHRLPSEVSSAQPSSASSFLQCIEKLPLAELAGQVLMVGLPANSMPEQAQIFKRYYVGGAILMTSPANPYDGSIKRFKEQASNDHLPLLVSTDEEGGIVQRFQSVGVLPPPETVADELSPSQAEALIAAHGIRLKAIGIDMILGPLADIAPSQGQSPLGNRVFSSDLHVVSSYDAAYVRGWQRAGLLPTLKHFPGLGSATGNTDYQPAITPPLSALMGRDFIPYKNLASSGTAVMVGNQTVPGWFSGPASLNPSVNLYLRQTLGYKNELVVTDSLAANAVTSTTSVPQAVVDAIAAGNDIALIVDTAVNNITPDENANLIKESVTALEEAVSRGVIPKQQLAQSVARKLSVQKITGCKPQ